MSDLHVVILAGGKGTRMRSALPKVVHRVSGLPLVEHVLRAAAPLAAASTTLVIGHGGDAVRRALAAWSDLRFIVQEPQLGTGHALLQAEPLLRDARGRLLLLSGDVPLLTTGTVRRLLEAHDRTAPVATVLTAMVDDPFGYGRIVRTDGGVAAIVEERDATPDERQIREVNSGIYVFDLCGLFDALRRVGSTNAQGEYYLTDIVGMYREQGLRVAAHTADDAQEIRGINSRAELAAVSGLVRRRKTDQLMAAGVTIEDPATTYIGPDVEIGPDTIVHPGVFLEGRTSIGAACEIHGGVRIVDSTIGDRVTVNNFCVIIGSHLAPDTRVGPFAHLRPGSDVGDGARVGNFVELKNTVLGAGSKANHLAYLGDATIGARVNVGAGTITCNYDGERKHRTIVEDEVFIGSDTQLVAPVRVGRGAYVAAGSSITDDVPAGALAIARGRQVNKDGWVERKKKRT